MIDGVLSPAHERTRMTLSNGEGLPPITATGLDGEPVRIDELVAGSWSVVLFYRGHW